MCQTLALLFNIVRLALREMFGSQEMESCNALAPDSLEEERAGFLCMRYAEQTRILSNAVLSSPGETNPTLRRAVETQAAKLSGRASSPTSPLPDEVERYVTKVALHAYKVTDRDIQALAEAGYSEDAIFELTLSAALGAGMARLEIGLNALKGDADATQSH